MPVKGASELRRTLKRLEREILAELREAFDDLAERTRTTAREFAPQLEGDLIESAGIEGRDRRDRIQRVVFFDTPYAARQHEDETLNPGPITALKPNAGPKYLRRAFVKETRDFVPDLRRRVAAATRRSIVR